MTDRRFGLQLRAGAHAELVRLADGLRQEAEKRLPKDRGALTAPRSVAACATPQLAVMVAGQQVWLQPAHPVLSRIDVVVKAMKVMEDRRPRIEVLTGVPATAPVAPTSVSNWLRAEVPLAQVLVKAGQVQVTQADIYPPDADIPPMRPRHARQSPAEPLLLPEEFAEPPALRPGVKIKRAQSSSFFPVMPLRLEPAEPPKREVLTVEAGLFTVADWCLATIDRVLAECVAREFDRIDPLPPVEGP